MRVLPAYPGKYRVSGWIRCEGVDTGQTGVYAEWIGGKGKWLNALEGTSGYLHWALNWWSIPLTSLGSPGDQYIVWPSRRFIANSSLRYEAEREGLEDCEALRRLQAALERRGLAREAALAELRRLARPAVRGIEDSTRSWDDLEAVRRAVIERVIAEEGKRE